MRLAHDQPGTWPLAFGIAAATCLAAGTGLAHFGVIEPIAGLGAFAGSGLLGLAGLAGGLVTMARGYRRRGAIAAVQGSIFFLLVAAGVFVARSHPPINDVSTDMADPPRMTHTAALRTGPTAAYSPGHRAMAELAYPDVKTLRVPHGPEPVFLEAVRLATSRTDWQIVLLDPACGVIEGIATTRLLRFQDDFAIRIRPRPGGSSVDMRSASRVGVGDLGVNAARIRTFLRSLEQSVSNWK